MALTPQSAVALGKLGYSCAIEAGAGAAARFSDEAYRAVGVEVLPSAAELWARADIVAKVKAKEADILSGKFTVKVDDSQPKSTAK